MFQCVSMLLKMVRFVALSSITSTRNRSSVDGGGAASFRNGVERRSNQAVKWNVLPFPGSLSTQIRPPISAASCDEIARPSPVPP